MHILLLARQTSLFSLHLTRVLRDRYLIVQMCSMLDNLGHLAFEQPPDLIVIVHHDTEQHLQTTLLNLQQNTKTISKPVIVIAQQPLSKNLVHHFEIQLKAIFVQPFLVDEFFTTIQQFAE